MKRYSIVFALWLMFAAGCATSGKTGKADAVMQTMRQWEAAMESADLDAMMAQYSEDWWDLQFGDKLGLRLFWESMIAEGVLKDAEVSLEQAQVTVAHKTAEVHAVGFRSRLGQMAMQFRLRYEHGGWLIVSPYS